MEEIKVDTTTPPVAVNDITFDIKIKASMSPQQYYTKFLELKAESKAIHDKMTVLENSFLDTFGLDSEHPIVDNNGKEKAIRVYKPQGQFVFNKTHEFGIRARKK